MQFAIPAATSITNLFVIKTDFYTNKETGEVRASVQALSPIPEGANGNGKGYEVTEYAADASVLDAIDLSNGPASYKFESQIRPIRNSYGKTTNTQVLTKALVEQVQRPQTAAPSKPAAPADSAKA
ncbi:DNA-binding protein [Aquipseudomonas alcaligenes]|uniref:DNA-binding protein n=1 Tax=Aquipseudomonas alcaligenes TaxID=43263 RepID=UPI001F2E50F9|nr:DNA-binding protein [Pseudomonas alcaligenes]